MTPVHQDVTGGGVLYNMPMSNVYLGLDYGHLRIGVARAVSPRIAVPLTVIEKSLNPTGVVLDLARREQATHLVVGLPRSLDSEDTIQTTAARAFATSLENHGFQIELQDEAGTSSLAEERLLASAKHYTKADIDAEAATIILQDYLDNL